MIALSDTYLIVKTRLANGQRIADSDIAKLCDEIKQLRHKNEQLEIALMEEMKRPCS